MVDSMQWLSDVFTDPAFLNNIFISIVIMAALWGLRTIILIFAQKHFGNSYLGYQFKKISGYVTAVLAIVLLGPMWLGGLKNAATFFGLLSAGLAIALQQIILNIAGWIFIILRRPFQVGDRIQIAQTSGDVIDLGVFQFSIVEVGNWVDADQSTGRIVHIPNGIIFREMTANYNEGFKFIWNEIPVLISFESNWQLAKQILIDIVNRQTASQAELAEQQVKNASRQFYIFFSKLTPTVYTNVKHSGIYLTIRYVCEPRQRRNTTQAIWEDILQEFQNYPDIHLVNIPIPPK